MKNLVRAVLVSAVLLLAAHAARADEITSFSGLVASGTFGCFGTDGQPTFCELSGYAKISVQVTCTANCPASATIAIQVRNSASDPWATVATITNPTDTEQGYNGPGVGQMQLLVTWTSGTLRGTVKRMEQ